MELRQRKQQRADPSLVPPTYTIDLSLRPRDRYVHIAPDFRAEAASLPDLFNEIVYDMGLKLSPARIKTIARLFLRRVASREETEELRGISDAMGIEMYLLVAFNVLLDLFMGCTSGGARVRNHDGSYKMLHFRTLDWGMDVLRKLVVQLEFVESKGGPVIARSMTYYGFVGVLTGVREGLSVSLNFRPNHDISSRWKKIRFTVQQILVLTGRRPAIASILRRQLYSPILKLRAKKDVPTLTEIECNMPEMLSTAAYLIYSDGKRTTTLEKDYNTAIMRSSDEFIVALNHDVDSEDRPAANTMDETTLDVTGMWTLVEASVSRKRCVVSLWERATRRRSEAARHAYVRERDVLEWMGSKYITNDETHYAVVMDPTVGEIIWSERYLEAGLDANEFLQDMRHVQNGNADD